MNWESRPPLFTNWKARASSMGHLCTNPDKITKKQRQQISILTQEKDTGVNANGRAVKWTDNKEKSLNDLVIQRDAPEVLSSGIITHLDDVFRSQFWGRKRLVFNKYLDKGNENEQDSLALLSDVSGGYLDKNETQFSNDYVIGTPDVKYPHVIDIKTNWDRDTYDKAELTSIYMWQVKAYIWLMLNNKQLTNWNGELVYCLVNSTYRQMDREKRRLFFTVNVDDDNDDDEIFVEAKLQMEKNMIFDLAKWKKEYPSYDLEHTRVNEPTWMMQVPDVCRVKRFPVILNTRDINLMSRRVKMAREYLIAKEKETLNKINGI
jgi:hypothetical protein